MYGVNGYEVEQINMFIISHHGPCPGTPWQKKPSSTQQKSTLLLTSSYIY